MLTDGEKRARIPRVGGRCRNSTLKANGADTKVMRELLPYPSTRVALDRYTQAVTPAKRLNCRRFAVLPQGEDCQAA
jgi:hypothetical protein